jgi:hypothetical protein
MKRISLNDKPTIEDLIEQAEDDEVLVTRDGHAVALVIPFDDQDADAESDPAFIESIQRAREQVSRGQFTSHNELKKQLGL